MELPTRIDLTPAMGQALARCAMIGYEGAEPADVDLDDDQFEELGKLIDSLMPEGMRSEG